MQRVRPSAIFCIRNVIGFGYTADESFSNYLAAKQIIDPEFESKLLSVSVRAGLAAVKKHAARGQR